MKILVGDVSSHLDNPKDNSQALALIRTICKARPENYMFMPKYRRGLWDGYISLMHSFSSFPTGMVPRVMDCLVEHGYHVEIVYDEPRCFKTDAVVTSTTLQGITLRDYQVEAANVMLQKTRGVMKMATNSGKTEVMAAVIKALECNTVVVLHRKELMYQTFERLIDRGIKDVGMIGDGLWTPNIVTVAMVQTLAQHGKVFPANCLLLVDECHHLSSDTYMDVFNRIPGSYRFGVSGTPLRYDVLADMKLLAATGDVIYDLSNAYLIEQGYSAKPTVFIKTMESRKRTDWDTEYQDAYSQFVVESDKRNAFIASYAKLNAGSTLILVNRLDHGKRLQELIAGSIFVHGNDTTEYRQSVITDMRSKAGVYIVSPIFDEGIDVPGVDTVILAAGGKSHIKLLQRIGRGMRRKEGTNTLKILDFIDDTNKFLLDHSNERIDTYVKEGFDTVLID